MHKAFDALGVSHAYAPGHEPDALDRLTAAFGPASADPAVLMLAACAAVAVLGIGISRRLQG